MSPSLSRSRLLFRRRLHGMNLLSLLVTLLVLLLRTWRFLTRVSWSMRSSTMCTGRIRLSMRRGLGGWRFLVCLIRGTRMRL